MLCRHHFHSIHFAKHNPTSAAYTSSLRPYYHCTLSSLSCESAKDNPRKDCKTLVIMRCLLRSDLLPGLPRGLPLAAITVSPRTLDLESAPIFDRFSACHLISASCTGIAIMTLHSCQTSGRISFRDFRGFGFGSCSTLIAFLNNNK